VGTPVGCPKVVGGEGMESIYWFVKTLRGKGVLTILHTEGGGKILSPHPRTNA
jgi:hypothetical protein